MTLLLELRKLLFPLERKLRGMFTNESVRKCAFRSAKEKYFNDHSDSRLLQENFNLMTPFIKDLVDTHIMSKNALSVQFHRYPLK